MKSAYHIIFENFMKRGYERAGRWELIVRFEQLNLEFRKLGERLREATRKWEDVR